MPLLLKAYKLIQGGGWRGRREVGSPGVGWRDGGKRHTTVIKKKKKKKKEGPLGIRWNLGSDSGDLKMEINFYLISKNLLFFSNFLWLEVHNKLLYLSIHIITFSHEIVLKMLLITYTEENVTVKTSNISIKSWIRQKRSQIVTVNTLTNVSMFYYSRSQVEAK